MFIIFLGYLIDMVSNVVLPFTFLSLSTLLCKMVSKASWSPSMSTSNSSISFRTVVLAWTVNLVPGLVTSKGCA